jgi:hypothetical protein
MWGRGRRFLELDLLHPTSTTSSISAVEAIGSITAAIPQLRARFSPGSVPSVSLLISQARRRGKRGRRWRGRYKVVMTEEISTLLRVCAVGKKESAALFTHEDGSPMKEFRGTWQSV